MNKLEINLLRTPVKSTLRKIFGILYLILSVLWLIMRVNLEKPVFNKTNLTFLDIIYVILFGFAGFIYLIEGYGISIAKWFGEAYIKIDDALICIKKGVFSKEWALQWDDIELIDITIIGIRFSLKDKRLRELSYDDLDYEHIQQIKQTIRSIAGEKNIKFSTFA
jgi:hypothetical protein